MRVTNTLFSLMSLAFLFTPAAAEVEEVRFGVLAQSCCGNGSNKEEGVSLNLEALFRSPEFLKAIGGPRPLVGLSIATDAEATDQFYGGLEWKIGIIDRVFGAATLGAALHNGETDPFDPVADADRVDETVFYGCRVLFRIGGDLGYDISETINVAVHYNHISNAGLCQDNEGLDHLGMRLGWKF